EVAQISGIDATPESAVQNADGAFTVPVRIVLKSRLVGEIAQEIRIPLVNEGGQWHVSWSPGLIFSQLDDPNDARYQRKVRFNDDTGHRGSILDRDGKVLAKDGLVREIDAIPSKANNGATVSALSKALGISADQIAKTFAGKPADQFIRLWLVPDEQFGAIGSALNGLPGVRVAAPSPGRVYPYGADTAAITGYVSVAQTDDVKNDPAYYSGTEQEGGHEGVQ